MGADRGVIYGLHAGDEVIRYVGLTRVGMLRRLDGHRRSARKGSDFPVHCWMRKHGVDAIAAIEIEECDIALLANREQFWIADLARRGARLLNATSGGDGVKDLSAEARAKISRAKSGANHPQYGKPAYIRGRKLPTPTPESIAARAASTRATWAKKHETFVPGSSHRGKTHCPKNHEYTPENTGIANGASGYPIRYCRACRKDYKARVRALERAKRPPMGEKDSRQIFGPETRELEPERIEQKVVFA